MTGHHRGSGTLPCILRPNCLQSAHVLTNHSQQQSKLQSPLTIAHVHNSAGLSLAVLPRPVVKVRRYFQPSSAIPRQHPPCSTVHCWPKRARLNIPQTLHSSFARSSTRPAFTTDSGGVSSFSASSEGPTEQSRTISTKFLSNQLRRRGSQGDNSFFKSTYRATLTPTAILLDLCNLIPKGMHPALEISLTSRHGNDAQTWDAKEADTFQTSLERLSITSASDVHWSTVPVLDCSFFWPYVTN